MLGRMILSGSMACCFGSQPWSGYAPAMARPWPGHGPARPWPGPAPHAGSRAHLLNFCFEPWEAFPTLRVGRAWPESNDTSHRYSLYEAAAILAQAVARRQRGRLADRPMAEAVAEALARRQRRRVEDRPMATTRHAYKPEYKHRRSGKKHCKSDYE